VWTRLKALLAYEPAALAWAVNGGLAAALVFLFHLDGTQAAAVTTITTALAAAFTAVKARPVAVSVLVGSAATIATACAAFGLNLTPQVIATGVAVLSAVLGLVFRQNLTPAMRVTTTTVTISPSTSSGVLSTGFLQYDLHNDPGPGGTAVAPVPPKETP